MSDSDHQVVDFSNAELPVEIIEQAKALEEQLRKDCEFDCLDAMDPSRTARLLQVLDKTLLFDSTQTLGLANDERPSITMPCEVGRFKIGCRLGKGGFGEVFKSYDTVLHRDVALKAVPRRPSLETAAGDFRLREARAAAKLNHPSLVPLYEVLDDEHFLYLVSELCDGPTLAEYLEQTGEPMRPDWAAEITLRLAQGIAHAHGRGLVHRDIKPSNVLLAPEHSDLDLLPFTPRLTDFGLVLDTDNDPVDYGQQRLIGTILYIPPEQLQGNAQVDARCGDVYTLGLLLYQMLAKKLPYRSTNAADRYREICTQPIPLIDGGPYPIPRDLHAIYRKALEKRPEQRYASAQLLVDDLMRFCDGRAVAARPQPVFEQTYHAIRRAPLLSGLMFAFVSLVLMSAGIFAVQNRSLREQADELKRAVQSASTSRKKVVQTAYLSDINQALLAVAKKDPSTAKSFLSEIREYADDLYQQRHDYRIVETMAGEGWKKLPSFNSAIEEIVFIPDLEQFVAAGGNRIRHYQLGIREPIQELTFKDGATVHALDVSPDGKVLAVGVSDNGLALSQLGFSNISVRLVSLSDGSIQNSLDNFESTVESLAFSVDGERLTVGCRYAPLKVFDLNEKKTVKTVDSDRRHEDVQMGPGNELTWISDARKLEVHDLNDRIENRSFQLPARNNYRRFHRSLDGRFIVATQFEKSHAHLFDLYQDRPDSTTLKNQHGELVSIRISNSGEFVVAGTVGGGIVVWKTDAVRSADKLDVNGLSDNGLSDNGLKSIELEKYSSIHGGPVTAVSINNEGVIVSGASDGSLAISSVHDVADGRHAFSLDEQSKYADLTPDGKIAIVGCVDGSVWSFELKSRKQVRIHDRTRAEVTALKISGSGRHVAVGWHDGRASVATIGARPNWYSLPNTDVDRNEAFPVTLLDFNPSDSRICICRAHSKLQWLNVTYSRSQSGAINAKIDTAFHAPTGIKALTIINDSTSLLLGDKTHVWSVQNHSSSPSQVGFEGILCQSYDKESKIVYVGCEDGRIRSLDGSGNLLATSQRWTPTVVSPQIGRQITAITLSPDSRSLLTGSDAGDVAVWDAASLRHLGPIWQADFAGEIGCIRVNERGDTIFVHQRWHHSRGSKSNGQLRWLSVK